MTLPNQPAVVLICSEIERLAQSSGCSLYLQSACVCRPAGRKNNSHCSSGKIQPTIYLEKWKYKYHCLFLFFLFVCCLFCCLGFFLIQFTLVENNACDLVALSLTLLATCRCVWMPWWTQLKLIGKTVEAVLKIFEILAQMRIQEMLLYSTSDVLKIFLKDEIEEWFDNSYTRVLPPKSSHR